MWLKQCNTHEITGFVSGDSEYIINYWDLKRICKLYYLSFKMDHTINTVFVKLLSFATVSDDQLITLRHNINNKRKLAS